jgi:hypothetical protein
MASEKKRIPLVVILLPLIAVLGLAGFMGLNLWKEYQRSEHEDEDARQRDAVEQQQRVKKRRQQVVEAGPLDAGLPVDDDDLANLPKGTPRRPRVAETPKAPTGTPAQRAYQGFKSAYDKLEAANETAVKKYRAQRLRLEDQLGGGNPTNEAKFVADCDALKAQILEALRNPENQ